jgi:hypothetical protein
VTEFSSKYQTRFLELVLPLPNYSSHISESDSTNPPFTKLKRNHMVGKG